MALFKAKEQTTNIIFCHKNIAKMMLFFIDKIRNILIVFVFLFSCASFANTQSLVIPSQMMLPIGIKIWFNECGGKVSGLTSWNQGEDFASLGIGHFTWHPFLSKHSPGDTFPYLIRFMRAKGVAIPTWLQGDGAKYCPWLTRTEFLNAQYSSRMIELRYFLQNTIPIQAEFMARHLEEILPEMLASIPPFERPYICREFYTLAKNPMGIYAMMDYLNFKGAGTKQSLYHGTGLLQVIEGMRHSPQGLTAIQEFTWSAKNALVRRVQSTSPTLHSERWLAGWFKRVNTYLDGPETQTALNSY